MKKCLTILWIAICSISIQAQSFEDFIRKGDEQYEAKNYVASGTAYDQAFQLEGGNASQYYNAACSWALSGDTTKSIQLLKLSADKGWKNKKWMAKDKDLNALHDVEGWAAILNQVQANLDEYEKDFDQPLKAQLEKIHVKDQTLRRLYRDAQEKFGRGSDEMIYFSQLMSHQDSLNELEVLKIIEEKGWVGKSLVGGEANMTLWLVVQHAPIETQKKYLPLLRESVKKGESQGSHLALLEDRILMRNDQPQIYGSQIRTNMETGEKYVYEIKDPEYVNQRRKEVGLGPIEDYVKRWGITWTIKQKER